MGKTRLMFLTTSLTVGGAEKMTWMLENREKAKNMGLEGKRIIEKSFTIEAMVSAT